MVTRVAQAHFPPAQAAWSRGRSEICGGRRPNRAP